MGDNSNNKVLLVGPIDTKGRYSGGIAYVVNSLIQNGCSFLEHGIDLIPVDSCCIQRKSYAAGELCIDNLVNAAKLIRLLKIKIKKEKPRVIYFNTSRRYSLLKDLLVLMMVGRRENIKTVLHVHFADVNELFPPQPLLKRRCWKLITKYVDHLVLLSEKTKNDLVAEGYNKEKISVIYNFHTLDFTREEITTKQSNALRKEKKDIVFIGSLDKRKGVIELLNAFDACTPFARLHMCGKFTDMEVQSLVENRLKQYPQGSVIMHGFVDGREKRDILLNSEIMVLPSYGEGFPIVLVEGLAAGCEILATDVGAIPEVFSEKTGKMIPAGSTVKLRDSLLDIIQNNHGFDKMMSNWELSQNFTLDRFIKKMCDVCVRVVDE